MIIHYGMAQGEREESVLSSLCIHLGWFSLVEQ